MLRYALLGAVRRHRCLSVLARHRCLGSCASFWHRGESRLRSRGPGSRSVAPVRSRSSLFPKAPQLAFPTLVRCARRTLASAWTAARSLSMTRLRRVASCRLSAMRDIHGRRLLSGSIRPGGIVLEELRTTSCRRFALLSNQKCGRWRHPAVRASWAYSPTTKKAPCGGS